MTRRITTPRGAVVAALRAMTLPLHTTATLASLLDEQATTLRAQLDGVYDGGVEAVHDARVAIRRVRELLALVPVVPGRDGEDGVAKDLKKIGRALGRVRDIDVQLALIADLEHHTTQAAPALVIVRQAYDSERLAKTRKLIKTLERLDVDGLLNRISDTHPRALRKRLTSNGWRRQLEQLIGERARNAAAAMVHARGVYFPNRAHGARIALKQLRYAAEIGAAIGVLDAAGAIKALRKGQDVLGHLHDRQTLADALKRHAAHDDIKAAHIALAREVLEREVLELHRDYLGRRAAVHEACSEIERAALRPWLGRRHIVVGTAAVALSGILYGRHALASRAIEA